MNTIESILELAKKLNLKISYLPLKGRSYIEAIYVGKHSSSIFLNIFFYENGRMDLAIAKEEYEDEEDQYSTSTIEKEENVNYFKIVSTFYHYFN